MFNYLNESVNLLMNNSHHYMYVLKTMSYATYIYFLE